MGVSPIGNTLKYLKWMVREILFKWMLRGFPILIEAHIYDLPDFENDFLCIAEHPRILINFPPPSMKFPSMFLCNVHLLIEPQTRAGRFITQRLGLFPLVEDSCGQYTSPILPSWSKVVNNGQYTSNIFQHGQAAYPRYIGCLGCRFVKVHRVTKPGVGPD